MLFFLNVMWFLLITMTNNHDLGYYTLICTSILLPSPSKYIATHSTSSYSLHHHASLHTMKCINQVQIFSQVFNFVSYLNY